MKKVLKSYHYSPLVSHNHHNTKYSHYTASMTSNDDKKQTSDLHVGEREEFKLSLIEESAEAAAAAVVAAAATTATDVAAEREPMTNGGGGGNDGNTNETATDARFKAFRRQALLLYPIGVVVLAVMASLMLTGVIPPMAGGRWTDNEYKLLTTFAGRLEFTFTYQTFSVLCLVVNFFHVIYCRSRARAANPTWTVADRSARRRLDVARGAMANTMEQLVLSVVNQLVACCFLSATATARVIPFMVLTFVVGRTLFLIGYPGAWRVVGFKVGTFPVLVLMAYNVVSFFIHL